MNIEELKDAEIKPVNFTATNDSLPKGQMAATIVDILDFEDGIHHAVKFEVMDKNDLGDDGNPKQFWQKFKTTDLQKMAKILK